MVERTAAEDKDIEWDWKSSASRSAGKNEKFSCGNKRPIQFTLVLVSRVQLLLLLPPLLVAKDMRSIINEITFLIAIL